jgi:DNA-binding XRE family transcriptional regulator
VTDRSERTIDLIIDGNAYVAVPAAIWNRIKSIDYTPAKGLAGTDAVAYARQSIARKLKELRRKAGLTQAALATALRVSQAHIANAEAARDQVSEALLKRWVKACGGEG